MYHFLVIINCLLINHLINSIFSCNKTTKGLVTKAIERKSGRTTKFLKLRFGEFFAYCCTDFWELLIDKSVGQ